MIKCPRLLVAYPAPLAASLLALCSMPTQGADLGPGQSATVTASQPAERWGLDSAVLDVLPGGSTLAIALRTASTLTVDGGSVQGGTSIGINANDSTVSMQNATLTSTGNYALSLTTNLGGSQPGSTGTVISSSITGASRGINMTRNSQLTVRDSTVSASATNGYGMTVFGSTAVLDNTAVTAPNIGVLIGADGVTATNVSLTLDNGSSVVASRNSALATVANGVANATVRVANGSTLTGGNGVILDIPVEATFAFTVDNSQLTGNIQAVEIATLNVDLRNNASLTGNVTNADSVLLDASTMTGDVTSLPGSGSTVDLRSGSSLFGAVSDVDTLTLDASEQTGTISNVTTAKLSNGSTLAGDVSNVQAFSLDGSTMTGNIRNVNALALLSSSLAGATDAVQTMSLDATSRWTLSGNSTVGALALDGGTVELGGGNGNFRVLSLGSLSGTGTFAMGTDLAGHLSDLIDVSGTAEGSHSLRVRNTGVEPAADDRPQRLVHTGGGAANFAVVGGVVDVGTYQYQLEKRGTEWFLVQATTGGPTDPTNPTDPGPVDPTDPTTPTDPGPTDPTDPTDPTTPTDPGPTDPTDPTDPGPTDPTNPPDPTEPTTPTNPGDGGGPIISPSTRAVVGVFSAAPTVWYGEQSTVLSRMGELRDGHTAGGAWARTYGNKYSVSAGDQVSYTQQQYGVSLGVDTPLPTQEGQWLLGVMAGYSQSDLDLQRGTSGSVDSYYAGLYSTWMNPAGYYVDALLKANRFRNKADVRMSDGAKAKGDYNNYGVGASVEVGKHIELGDAWYLEPFVQGSMLWVEGEGYGLDNGLEARSNHANSMLGKVGSHLGRRVPLANGGFVQPYIKLAAAHEFARNNKVNVNGNRFTDDLSGTRGEVGAGVAAQITDVLQVHADTSYSSGDAVEQRWGVNLGLRYSW